jgi:hypothetical protein
MAKAKLIFDLNDPDDMREHLCAVHGQDFAFLIWELKHNILRRAYKDELDPKEIIDLIHEKINELGIDVDELVV